MKQATYKISVFSAQDGSDLFTLFVHDSEAVAEAKAAFFWDDALNTRATYEAV